jgi:formylglycine-generating enzyme required for sulfatase activity
MVMHALGKAAATALVLAAAVCGQADKDGKTAKEIAAKEAQIKEAELKLAGADRGLQDVYLQLETRWTALKSGSRDPVLNDLRRILEEPAAKAKEAGKDPTRGRRALEATLARWLPKLEQEILALAPARTRECVLAGYDALAANAAEITPLGLAEAAVAHLFGGTIQFHQLWNEEITRKRPETKTFVDAGALVAKLRTDLMVLRDPRTAYSVGAPNGMARIPEGSYAVEGLYGFERKKKAARVKAFYIDLHEVTHEDYFKNYWAKIADPAKQEARVPRNKDRKPLWPRHPETQAYQIPPEMLRLPVSGVDCEAALDYAQTIGKRLPTEAEWVAAAAATPKGDSEYPWIGEYQPGLCNDKRQESEAAMPVDSFPDGRSCFGVFNLAGNVKEWCATVQETFKDFADKIPSGENVVIRGGSYRSSAREVSNKWRWGLLPQFSYEDDVGFRCVKDIEK